jgi:hypothetical protein
MTLHQSERRCEQFTCQGLGLLGMGRKMVRYQPMAEGPLAGTKPDE